jgi:predicted kinase
MDESRCAREWPTRLPESEPMKRPTMFLTVGLPGMGKTTYARRLEVDHDALRLTKDEWMKALYGLENPSSASDVIEGRLIQIGLRTLQLGVNVIVDFGLWSRDERTALRDAAARSGADVVIAFFDLPLVEQLRRLRARLAANPHETWPISEAELRVWAAKFQRPTRGELQGTEPLDPPPAGFADWQAWIATRWPAQIQT